MTRMTAQRLAEIEQLHSEGTALMDSKIERWSADRGDIHNLADSALDAVSDFLAELRAVQQERDEAVDAFNFANEHRVRAEKELADLEVERNELKQRYHPEGVCIPMGTANALRAEVSRLKAVADAAKSIDWMENAHDASIYIVTCRMAQRLLSALAALDGRDEKGKGV